MGNTFYFEWEPALMVILQRLFGGFGVKVFSIITMFGETMVMVGVLGYLYWCLNKEFGKFVGTGIVLGTVLNPMFKNIALRRRPYFDNAAVKCLKPVEPDADIFDIKAQGYSFPSGHSTNSAITYCGSALAYRKYYGKKSLLLDIGSGLLVLLIGLSRIVLGVHYPTDVLCGFVLGTVILFIVSWMYRSKIDKWKLYLFISVASLAGFIYCRTDDYFTGVGTMIGFFLGDLFEERFVQFKNTRNVLKTILRIVGGFIIYLGLNSLLKMPFSHDFLASGTMVSFTVRTVRYIIVMFVMVGLYPMIFDKIGFLKEKDNEYH